MSEKKDGMLFDTPSFFEEEWGGMPEFIQTKKEPYSKLIVRFDNEDDLRAFSKIINQKINKKTKSIWFPFKSHWRKGVQPKWEGADES